MEISKIKNVIQKDINSINDIELLDALRIFIETHLLNQGEPELNEEQIRRLKISREQSKNNEFFSNEEVDNEIDLWLREKE